MFLFKEFPFTDILGKSEQTILKVDWQNEKNSWFSTWSLRLKINLTGLKTAGKRTVWNCLCFYHLSCSCMIITLYMFFWREAVKTVTKFFYSINCRCRADGLISINQTQLSLASKDCKAFLEKQNKFLLIYSEPLTQQFNCKIKGQSLENVFYLQEHRKPLRNTK